MCNIKDVCCNLVSVKWSIASWMSSKLEPVIWLRVLVTLAYMKERTDVRTYVRMYVRTLYVGTDVHDVMAVKPNFLTSMGYHIFLSMVLRARVPSARAELRYNQSPSRVELLSQSQQSIQIASEKRGLKISTHSNFVFRNLASTSRLICSSGVTVR